MEQYSRAYLQPTLQTSLKTIEDYIFKLEGQQKAITLYLHNRLTSYHDLQGKISYNIPVYYRKTWVCYLNPVKNDGVELAFAKGHRLSNDQDILLRKKRKYVAGVELFDISAIPEVQINEIINEALILDDLTKIE